MGVMPENACESLCDGAVYLVVTSRRNRFEQIGNGKCSFDRVADVIADVVVKCFFERKLRSECLALRACCNALAGLQFLCHVFLSALRVLIGSRGEAVNLRLDAGQE